MERYNMRILGIDYGDKKIGLAVSDKLFLTAQALGYYILKNQKEDKKYFQNLVADYNIKKIVIGLPVLMDGTHGTRAQKTKQFSLWLEKTVNIPVILWDERLTTKQALAILRQQKASIKEKKKRKHQLSAALILASYLESTPKNVSKDY